MSGALSAMIAAAFAGGGAAVSDPYFEYTTLLLPGNGTNGAQNNTFLDASTNNFTITRNGNTTQGTFSPFSQTGWGNYFNGSSYLSAGTTLFNYTTGNASTTTFTIEAFVYLTSYQTAANIYHSPSIISKGDVYLNLGVNGSGNLIFYHYDGTVRSITGSTVIPLNTWTYVAVTVTGGTATIYVNGSSVGSGTWYGIQSAGQNTTSLIGRASTNASSLYFNGYMSNLRVSTVARTITTPTVAYTNDANTALLTAQSNRFVDNSSSPITLTLTGSPSVQAFSPFNPSASWSAATYGGSGYFDGNNDYLQGPVNSAFAFGTGEYCMEGWIYMTSAPASPSGLIDLRRAAPNYNAPWLNVTSGYKLALRDGTLGVDVVTGATNIQLNTWTHVAVTRQVTSNAGTRIFLNGVLDANSITNNSNYSNGALTLATAGDSLGNYMFTGYMSDVRITKGSVPTSYQTSATTSGTVVFTPPTSPETTTSQGASSPSILLNFTNAGIYDATSKNDLETVGDARISTAISAKWGTGSILLEGTSDRLFNGTSSPLLNLSSGDWTVECWVYFNAVAAYAYVLNIAAAPSNNSGVVLGINNTSKIYIGNGVVLGTAGNTTLSTGQWYYLAWVKSGANVTMYVNGSSDVTPFAFTPNSGTYAYIGSDASAGNQLNAYIQDLRVTRGVARAISLPTAAFPTL